MKKILTILTSHRLDCLKICLKALENGDAYRHFDVTVFILNGVEGAHLDYVKTYMRERPEYTWDTVAGPRGRSEKISALSNQIVERYPDSLYVKIDEDFFVPPEFAPRIFETYEKHREMDNLGLITLLFPNHSLGLHRLLTAFYPQKLERFKSLFNQDPNPEIRGSTWSQPDIGEWASRQFINLNEANAAHQALFAETQPERYHYFSHAFSICGICWDYTHWEKMGGIPPKEEPVWCKWIEDNGYTNVVDQSMIGLHYSYGLQQEWLDRTHLLEDMWNANVEPGLQLRGAAYHGPRIKRVTAQLPRAVIRKTRHLLGK